MITRKFLLAAMAIFWAQFLASEEAAERNEPPQLFFLEAAGKKFPIELDKPFNLEWAKGAEAATLRVEAHRVFSYGGVLFHYPREYTYKVDFETQNLRQWTMSGDTCIIFVNCFKNEADHKAMRNTVAQAMAASYGKEAKISPCKLKLKDTSLDGEVVQARLAGIFMRQELYSFNVGENSVVFIVQDTPQKDGKPSTDREHAEKLLVETFKIRTK